MILEQSDKNATVLSVKKETAFNPPSFPHFIISYKITK